MHFLSVLALGLSAIHLIVGSPATLEKLLEARKDPSPDNTVHITNADQFCMIVPRDEHTDIGVSERPGGTKSYCSANGRKSDQQGKLPDGFWRKVDFKTGNGKNGKRFAQLTGCIRPELLDRLNARDAGGQYDSNGGVGGRGNPQGSQCIGYNQYVELIEPGGNRACIKCCDDPADCPVNKDTSGCQSVIPGNYFDCS